MKKSVWILFFTFWVLNSFAQHSRFYYQRVSLFEILPATSKDIIFLGNSITNGVEWSELLNNPYAKNRGISGDIAEGVYDRLSVITKGKPEKIFLMIGINDLLKGKLPEMVASDIKRILQKIKKDSQKTEIYLQSVLPTSRKLSEEVMAQGGVMGLNERLINIAKELDVTYIDLYTSFRNENNELNKNYSNDGLHLLGEGYLLWKQLIEPYLKSSSK